MTGKVANRDNLFVRDWEVSIQGAPVPIRQQLSKDLESLKSVTGGEKPPQLHIWSAHSALVVGQTETRLPNYQNARSALAETGWEVVHRTSGGTAFPQCSGILNVSAALPIDSQRVSIKQSYQGFCDVLIDGLAKSGISGKEGQQARAFCDGDYNILASGRKLIGTAQRWKMGRSNHGLLAHAAIFFEINQAQLSELVNRFYQLAGSDKKFYAEALIDIREIIPSLRKEAFVKNLIDAFRPEV